jgi:GEVED domain
LSHPAHHSTFRPANLLTLIQRRLRKPSRRQRHVVNQPSCVWLADPLEDRVLLAGHSDFGDAPAPYPVLIAENGASHEVTTYQIGATVFTTPDGVHSPLADADPGDDGVFFGNVLIYPGARNVSAYVSLQGSQGNGVYMDAWIDFNADGDWLDPGEQIIDSERSSGGSNRYSFDVPDDAVVGTSFARFRVSADPDLTSDGSTVGGEVEDYLVEVVFPPPTPDGTVTGTQRPTITWDPITDATGYEVYLQHFSNGAFETGNRIERYTVTDPFLSLPFDLPIGTQTLMWLRSSDGSGSPSVWSRRYSIIVTDVAPVMLPLAQNQPTGTPLLEWTSLAGGEDYDLWVSNLTTNASQVIRTTVIRTSQDDVSFTPEDELPIGEYRAWVRAEPSFGPYPEFWSVPVNFRVMTAPVPTDGLNSTFDRTPTFGWDSVPGAATYEVQLVDANTGTIVQNPVGIVGTSWTPSADLPDGPYRWQVIAVEQSGFRSLWSDPTEIYVGGRSQLLSPVGDVIQRRQTFTWTTVDGAATYDLLVLDNQGGTQLDESGIASTSFDAVLGLFDYGSQIPMRAWVRAVSGVGEVSIWSELQNFTVIYE